MSSEYTISRTAVVDPLVQKAFWMRMLYGAVVPPALHIKHGPECESNSGPFSAMFEDGMRNSGAVSDSRTAEAAFIASVLIVLYKYTGEKDLLAGVTPPNWRGETPLTDCLLPLRRMIRPEDSIGDVLNAVATTLQKMHQNQAARSALLRWQSPVPAHADGWPKLNVAIVPDWASTVIPESPDRGLTVALSSSMNHFRLAGQFDGRRFDDRGARHFLSEVKEVAHRIMGGGTARVADVLELTVDVPIVEASSDPGDGEAISWSQDTVNHLTAGGEIVVASGELQNPAVLWRVLHNHRAPVVQLSPYILAGLLEYAETLSPMEQRLDHLKFVVLSREPAHVSLANEWLRAYPDTPLVQTLEAFAGSPGVIIRKPVDGQRLCVPIFSGAQSGIRLCTHDGRPAPAGTPGEIWVTSGPGNPWHGTGEWGKRIVGGGVEWFGRLVDLPAVERGLERVHLEAVLSSHPDIRYCVVVSRQEDEAGPPLIACVLGRRGARPQEAQLADFAASRLGGMFEFQIRYVESVPLLADGQVDRDALRQAGGRDGTPRNTVDEVLASLWSEMLQAPSVGIHDEFFALGGHSVMAMQITARIRRIFQTDISLRNVFESPTIAHISDMLVSLEKTPGQAEKLARIWQRARTISADEIKELLHQSQAPNS